MTIYVKFPLVSECERLVFETLRDVSTPMWLRKVDWHLGVHLRQGLIDDPHMWAVTKIEEPAHRILRHAKLLRELELRPALLAHRHVDRELRGDKRRQHGAVLPGMTGAVPRQWPASLHVTFERRNHAIDGVRARLFLRLALGQSLRNAGEADELLPVLLPLQRVSITERHPQFSKSVFVSPSCLKHRVQQARADLLLPIL